MSSENEDCGLLDKATDTSYKIDKGSKISYTREFLLSLSELEICKKLPSGFDQSLLRRTEYGPSPPTRGDSTNYSRGGYGRWDSRSSGRSDRDSDSQSDRESEPRRRYSNQSQKSWQGTEHDGLLGSGSFPRPSGYATGISAPKLRPNDQYQLNRSNEPYHPPRPYKAAPLSRRDTDSYNDETFGSTEGTSEDRVEEEKRRRASFELMRKEQQKALQEKQKYNLEKPKADTISNISLLLGDTNEEKGIKNGASELDSTTDLSISTIKSGKCALPSHATCRPVVPPGFKNTVLEKTSALKSLIQCQSGDNDNISGLEKKFSGEISLSRELPEDKTMHISCMNKVEQIANLDVSSKKTDMGDFLHHSSILPEALEALNEPEMIKLNAKASGLEPVCELHQTDSASGLEKIFSNASTVNDSYSVNSVEHHDNKPDDSWSQNPVHSSKFACWFVEEERKTEDNLSSSRQNDLLSLIVGSDKQRNQVDIKTFEHFPAEIPDQRTEIANEPTVKASLATNGVSESFVAVGIPAILTCEDLEQTILSEYGEKSPPNSAPLEGWSLSGTKSMSERPRAHVDNHASQHLLSLLQKGATQKSTTPKIPADIDPSEMQSASDVYDVGAAPYKTGEEGGSHTSRETLTLETLFGTAFMKELKSVEAPVSVQRGSVGSAEAETLEPHGPSFHVTDNNGLFPSTLDQIEPDKMTNDKNFLVPSDRQQVNVDKTEQWLKYDNPQIGLNLSEEKSELLKHGAFDGSVEYHLPEGEGLIAVNEGLNAQLSRLISGRNSSKKETSASNAPGIIEDKLAAINIATKDERSMTGSDGLPFLCGPLTQMEHEIAHGDLHTQTSSYFHSLQMSHGKPLLHLLDSHPPHTSSQMRLFGREGMIQHDALSNQQFPASMFRPPFHWPNVGATGFEHPSHHAMLHQMQMPGGFSSHTVNNFPRGASVPHLGNQVPRFMQELDPNPGHPFGPRQPNNGGLGMPLPAPDVNGGSNHPEAFQRLVEMELRTKSKQIPPFDVGQGQAIYGHELDMGFRYR